MKDLSSRWVAKPRRLTPLLGDAAPGSSLPVTARLTAQVRGTGSIALQTPSARDGGACLVAGCMSGVISLFEKGLPASESISLKGVVSMNRYLVLTPSVRFMYGGVGQRTLRWFAANPRVSLRDH